MANDCDVVRQSAERGRVNATVPLENIERETVEKIERAASCVETFNQVAQKITMISGGIDLTPAKKLLRPTVCGVANRLVSQAGNEVQRTVSDATGVDVRRVVGAAERAGVSTTVTRPVEKNTGSIWGRVSCAMGNC
jgi:hypothetical protein